jgi:hypothetical protein
MPTYDSTRFDPPAPLAEVNLRNPATGAVEPDVPMLLDTGADVTLVPQAAVTLLGLTVVPDKYYELTSFNGATSLAPIVRLELLFSGRTFRGQFLLTDQEIGIIGRNILNNVPLLFDGPHLMWNEQRLA